MCGLRCGHCCSLFYMVVIAIVEHRICGSVVRDVLISPRPTYVLSGRVAAYPVSTLTRTKYIPAPHHLLISARVPSKYFSANYWQPSTFTPRALKIAASWGFAAVVLFANDKYGGYRYVGTHQRWHTQQ